MTINASSLDDIEPSAIGQRLTNGTASVASPVLSRLKTREEEHVDVVSRATMPAGLSQWTGGCRLQSLSAPLCSQGTVYEKTNAEMEMKKINREEFWEQAKVSRGVHCFMPGLQRIPLAGGAKLTAYNRLE